MRFIRTWLLRYRLAQIFKRAEQAVDLGRQPGDQVFIKLMFDALKLIGNHQAHFKDFDREIEVPALADLEKLTIKPVPIDINLKVKQVFVAAFAASIGFGTLCAMASGTYHLWMHLFRLIGG